MNPIQEVGHAIEVAAEDVAKAVAYPVKFLVKAEKVIASAIHDQPAIKSAVLDLVKQADTVVTDIGTDVAAKGLNLTSDAKTLADAEAFFTYFRDTFIPLVEQVYGEVAADLK